MPQPAATNAEATRAALQPPPPPDGRRARAEASRARIAAAMLDLCREGVAEPSAEQVARRAGVGRRTVFRLFRDMDALYADMHVAMLERVRPILQAAPPGADASERLDALVRRRAALFEDILPVREAADLHRGRSAFLQARLADTNAMLRAALRFVVKDTAGAPGGLSLRFEALDLALSFEAWRRLRRAQALSPAAAEAVFAHLARRIAGSAEQGDGPLRADEQAG